VFLNEKRCKNKIYISYCFILIIFIIFKRMKEITFNIFKLFFLKLMSFFFPKYFKNFYLENNLEYKKQIYFEGAGGYMSYYLGIMKMIKETYPEEVLEKIAWSGCSAGIFPIIFRKLISIDNIFYYTLTKLNFLEQKWYGGINKFSNIFINYIYKKIIFNKPNIYLSNEKNLFLAVLNINIICPFFSSISFYYNFNNYEEFTETCSASHGIPFFTGPPNITILNHPTKWYIKRMDAAVLTIIYGFLFGYDTFMPYGNKINHIIISPIIFRPLDLSWFWITPNVIHHKKLYELGYEDAKKNIELMNKIIL
jgi:hypothetical protein